MNSIILQYQSIHHNPNCGRSRRSRCTCGAWVRGQPSRESTETRYYRTLQRNATLIERSTYTDYDIGEEVTKELWRLQDGWCIRLTIVEGGLSEPELISPDQAKETLQKSKDDAEREFEEAKARLEQAEEVLTRLLNP